MNNIKIKLIFVKNYIFQVTIDDGLPNKICLVCKTITIQSYNFKQQCDSSESKLKNKPAHYVGILKFKGCVDGS